MADTALLVVMSLLLAVVCLVLVVLVLGCVMRAFRTTKRRKRGFDTVPNPYAQQTSSHGSSDALTRPEEPAPVPSMQELLESFMAVLRTTGIAIRVVPRYALDEHRRRQQSDEDIGEGDLELGGSTGSIVLQAHLAVETGSASGSNASKSGVREWIVLRSNYPNPNTIMDRVDTKELRRVEAGITSPSFQYAESHNLLPSDVSPENCLSIHTSDRNRSLDLITSSKLECSAIRQGLGLYIAFIANQYQSSVP